MEYGNYTDHIQIGHAGDALNLLEQVLEKNDLDAESRAVIEAVKDAIDRGIV